MDVARIHVCAWQVAYRTLLPQEYLDRLRPEDRAESYDFSSRDPSSPKTVVAVDEDRMLGFATFAPSRDSDLASHGEVYALYVHPEYWGRGIGLALIQDARARLFARGFRRALLWVLSGNLRAEGFYQKDQWILDGMQRRDTVWGVQVDEVRYQRELEVPHAV